MYLITDGTKTYTKIIPDKAVYKKKNIKSSIFYG